MLMLKKTKEEDNNRTPRNKGRRPSSSSSLHLIKFSTVLTILVLKILLLLGGNINLTEAAALTSRSKIHMTMPSSFAASTSTTALGRGSNARPIKVAVIGAGAAGLATARVLSRNGIHVQILEKDGGTSSRLGGVWNYVSDDKTRPMYRGLRTNLPREIMAFREKRWGGDPTTSSFVAHDQVAKYLNDYATEFDLKQYIHNGCKVKQLTIIDKEEDKILPYNRIKLEWDNNNNHNNDSSQMDNSATITNTIGTTTPQQQCSDIFDAVCICNGHYAAPAIPNVPGLENFKGKIMHSIEYDDPADFVGKKVLCVGGRASGSDLAREISEYADMVYLSDTTCPTPSKDDDDDDDEKKDEIEVPITVGNVTWVPRTIRVDENSAIHFDYPLPSSTIPTPSDVDTIVFCSGYDYKFPFINDKSNLELSVVPGERRVKPLYEQLWHAQHPSLTFVGLQHSVLPFPFFELQAEAIVAQILQTSPHPIPNLKDRTLAATKDAESGGPKQPGRVQDTHYLGGHQWAWYKKYAKIAGHGDSLENYIETNKAIYDHSNLLRKDLFPGGPDEYRYHSFVRSDESKSFTVTPVPKTENCRVSSILK